MTSERRSVAQRSGVAGSTYKGVTLAVAVALWAAQCGAAFAQVVPDNRDLRLDPEDSVPPAYRETLEERDRQRLGAARESGGTYLPTFQGASSGPGGAAVPGERAPAPPQTLVPQTLVPQTVYEGYRRPAPQHPSEQGSRRAGDLRPEGLVGVLIEAWTRAPEIVRVRWPATAAHDPAAGEDGNVVPEEGRAARTAASDLPQVAAGTGLYARTMYAVDSDYPGPVLLEILEPPLAGAVAIGQFSLVRERLALRLGRVEFRGRSLAVDAWAAGLDCACYGVEGEVDSHWFERVLLPSAVRFAEGFLAALSRPSETVTIGDDVRYERRGAATRDAVHAGLATAARTAGDVLLENAPDGPTVRIARDTELVVVFAAPPDGPRGSDGDGRDG